MRSAAKKVSAGLTLVDSTDPFDRTMGITASDGSRDYIPFMAVKESSDPGNRWAGGEARDLAIAALNHGASPEDIGGHLNKCSDCVNFVVAKGVMGS